MVFEGILEEISEQAGNGFSADYVHLGRNSDPVMNGQRTFYVDFSRKAPPPPKTPKKAKTDGASNDVTTTTRKKQSKKSKTASQSDKKGKTVVIRNGKFYVPDADDFENGNENFDEDDFGLGTFAHRVGSKACNAQNKAVLPKEQTQMLVDRIKKLVSLWADEERMNGNKVFYWNIMNKDETNTISTQVPTSMEELSSFGILGENIERENGKRPIKSIGRLSSWKISKNILILMAQSA
uniref:Uncharacterized protein n=1 Tax=Ditylum brightwellii TaxID=49249 RepID=A0A7S4WE36_9STRA